MTGQQVVLLYAAERYATTGDGRRIREAADVSMADVARAINAPESTISRWETSKHLPRGEAAMRWAELLGRLESMRAVA